VRNFTTDRALLLAAVRKAIPRIPPTGREYLSDIDTMYQMAGNLSQLPGRKNVLWFSGGSTFYLREVRTCTRIRRRGAICMTCWRRSALPFNPSMREA
jgi:hypothetical protein